MSKEAQGPTPQQPRWIDAAPEARRWLLERMASLGERPDVQELLMYLNSFPTDSPIPVPSAVPGVGITHEFVSWLSGFERHARGQLEALAIADGADAFIRRGSRTNANNQQNTPPGGTS